jgi:hypothetical protein
MIRASRRRAGGGGASVSIGTAGFAGRGAILAAALPLTLAAALAPGFVAPVRTEKFIKVH